MGAGRRPTGRDGPHVFVADLVAPELTAADDHHLRRSLRTRPGDALTIGDGAGRWRTAVLTDGGVEATGDVVEVPAPSSPVTVGFTPVKGVRPEFVVQKLVELGVDRIVPLVADRSVVRWDGGRAARQVDRFSVVAREAAMQSRQVRLPTVAAVTAVGELLAVEGVALAHPGGEPLTAPLPVLLVGPEGGWSDAELAGAGTLVGLSASVLRAETAAIVAGALLVDRRPEW